jgi:dTDP-glucose 4,6-dehydratase
MQSDVSAPVNIGNPYEITMNTLARTVSEICGVEFKSESQPLPPNDPKRRRPDITRAKELLGWEPRTSLKDGLGKTLEYFQEQN